MNKKTLIIIAVVTLMVVAIAIPLGLKYMNKKKADKLNATKEAPKAPVDIKEPVPSKEAPTPKEEG